MTGGPVPGSVRDQARAVADAVLYEGYLLYPYHANTRKNQSRWQFGVLGPEGAAAAGVGEDSELGAQFLVEAAPTATLRLTVRFLQLQRRAVEDAAGRTVPELRAGARVWTGWDEAVEQEIDSGPMPLSDNTFRIDVDGGVETEDIAADDGAPLGRLVRTRRPQTGSVVTVVESVGRYQRISVTVRNLGFPAADKDDALTRSFLGAHVLAELRDGVFLSLLDPPAEAAAAAAACTRHRCFPVLAGPAGTDDLLLISPIILYDHPRIAEQSEGPLFDSTEIDEILTLRVLTLTDDEKDQARATDPRAAELIDRCEAMTPEQMRGLHGLLRDAEPGPARVVPALDPETPWWDPLADNAVNPDSDAVVISGTPVARGSRVRLRPARRADAQDLFYAGRTARVASVHQDVDGHLHLAVVVEDDPAAELHEWYGRYLYFAPDEVEPLGAPPD
ncbi:hypothetical protein [Nocardia aurantiaca]|uniref:Uncharacterized protein n=1 Tax=Nocardia aurantiaca TaxID=2675850 RepID=A0A6I3L5R9_9NOCA|nr:hypothetical protein [Nocardia aurantiaca]MTE16698.1 hypothetical protein [Nocardia aurantiaca]